MSGAPTLVRHEHYGRGSPFTKATGGTVVRAFIRGGPATVAAAENLNWIWCVEQSGSDIIQYEILANSGNGIVLTPFKLGDSRPDSGRVRVVYRIGIVADEHPSTVRWGDVVAYSVISDSDLIPWSGGVSPVDADVWVEFRLRDGSKSRAAAKELYWKHVNEAEDIMAYRVLPAGQTPDDATVVDAEVPKGDQRGTVDTREYSGAKTSYYELEIKSPTREGRKPYTAECNDIIEAAGMTFAEGEAFKAIWRGAVARMGLAKRGYTDGLYDAQKVAFYGGRMVIQQQAARDTDIF